MSRPSSPSRPLGGGGRLPDRPASSRAGSASPAAPYSTRRDAGGVEREASRSSDSQTAAVRRLVGRALTAPAALAGRPISAEWTPPDDVPPPSSPPEWPPEPPQPPSPRPDEVPVDDPDEVPDDEPEEAPGGELARLR